MRERQRPPGRPGPPGSPASGFSLLEMLLVMALVAAASLLAVAAMGGGLQGMQLRAGAKELAAQFRFARAVAISSGEPQDVVIDPRARRWEGAKGRSGTLPGSGEIVFTGARATQLAQPAPGDALPADDGKGVVRFFADGAATGGRVRMLAGNAGARGGWDVDVGWLTGEVRVSRVQAPP
jgi:general secretion pathway protein H